MFNGIENIKIILIQQKEFRPYGKTESRLYNTFYFIMQGAVLCIYNGKETLAKAGDVLFVPKGTLNEFMTLCEGTRYTGIYFDANFSEATYPCCYSLEKFHEADYIAKNITDMYKSGTQADKYRCLSLLYNLLSHLAANENANYDKEKFNIIAPAVEYLKDHINDCALKVEKLHRLCGISDTYFRQIFASRFGQTPQKYILSKRLSQAKSIIAGGDFDTISEVALSVGFNDPLYFSKVYKNAYGVSPSKAFRQED